MNLNVNDGVPLEVKVVEALKARAIRDRWAPSNARGNYPSRLGHPCDLKLYNDRTCAAEGIPPDMDSVIRMNEGTYHEKILLQQLVEAGFVVQDYQTSFEDPVHKIYGRLDWRINVEGHAFPFDAKTCGHFVFGGVNDAGDLLASDRHWVKGWFYQLACYILTTNEAPGYILLKNRENGALKCFPIPFDDRLAIVGESIYKRCDRLNLLVDKKTPPDRMRYDVDVCGWCDYRVKCWGEAEKFGPEAAHLDDLKLLALCEDRDTYKAARDAYVKADDALKVALKALKVPVGTIASQYQFQVKEIVKLVKAQAERTEVQQRVTVKRLGAPVDVEA